MCYVLLQDRTANIFLKMCLYVYIISQIYMYYDYNT